MEGRWFTGGYDELGLDIKLDRDRRRDARARHRSHRAEAGRRRAGAQDLRRQLLGVAAAADIDLGPGLTVTRVVNVTPDVATVTVDVAATAAIGMRDLFIAGSSRQRALAVFDRVDSIKVKPDWAMARVGGVTFPKALAQFEAWAYSNGADGRADTPDDIELGLVDAQWSMEEFTATYDDDDIKFVGAIDAKTGRFTPNIDGPNPARAGARNNIGDVWVVATIRRGSRRRQTGGDPARARAPAGHRAAVHAFRSVGRPA